MLFDIDLGTPSLKGLLAYRYMLRNWFYSEDLKQEGLCFPLVVDLVSLNKSVDLICSLSNKVLIYRTVCVTLRFKPVYRFLDSCVGCKMALYSVDDGERPEIS